MLGSNHVSDSSSSEAGLRSCLKYCGFSVTCIVCDYDNEPLIPEDFPVGREVRVTSKYLFLL